MTVRYASALALVAALLAGCSSAPPAKPDPVDVSGVVLLPSGQPAKDTTVTFFPTTGDQLQNGAKLKADGKFAVKLTPGKYTYSVEGDPRSVPAKYQSNDAAHAIEVPAGGTTDLKITLSN
jgi:hypothetical protein